MNAQEAIERLEQLIESEEIPEQDEGWVLDCLGHEDAGVRAAAALAVGEHWPTPAAFEALSEMLVDAAPEVRAAVCEAWGPLVLEAAENDLLAIDGRPDWVVERGWIAPEDARAVVEALETLAGRETEHPGVRGAALRSLGYLAERPSVIKLIESASAGSDPDGRLAAIEAAAASEAAERWSATVITALGDPEARVRAAAALAAGQLGLAAALPYLESMGMEGEEEEQLAAAISSLFLTPEDERELLLEQLLLRGVPFEIVDEARAAVEDLEYADDDELDDEGYDEE